MRIGILTYHSSLNYGAVWQTYASVQFLRSLGHEAFVVDYRNSRDTQFYAPFSFDAGRARKEGLKYLIKYPALVFARCRKAFAFRRFVRNQLPLLPLAEAEGLDVLLVGSDQVWNKQITGGPDPVYFGERFAGVRQVAWAASAGRTVLEEADIQALLKNFSAISVREQSLAGRIPQSIVLPDPTMMIGPAEWRKLVHPVKGKFLLAFPMLHEQEVMEVARQKAREMQLELKVVTSYVKFRPRWIQAASPEEVLSLINAAEYVVTSSYHGAVLTRQFDRPHTFIFHDDPRFDTLLQTDLSLAPGKAKDFLDLTLNELGR
ncbi:MAG: polysaccharide pyruvyl transferase family protein [Bacteroidales bacterium]|nr:polysaccharide pyruvyl transferase family protein [Bacteroidales bacterium]